MSSILVADNDVVILKIESQNAANGQPAQRICKRIFVCLPHCSCSRGPNSLVYPASIFCLHPVTFTTRTRPQSLRRRRPRGRAGVDQCDHQCGLPVGAQKLTPYERSLPHHHRRDRRSARGDLLRDVDPLWYCWGIRAIGSAGQGRLHPCCRCCSSVGRWLGLGFTADTSQRRVMTRAPGNGRASERRQAYNLVVIDNGAAVQVRALRVRAAEWSVALIDHLPFGGTCALRRCDPKEDADQRCRGDAIDWAKRMRGRGVTIELAITWPELIASSAPSPIPSHWNIARLNCNRGLTKDFETTVESTLSWLSFARVKLLMRRLEYHSHQL